MPQWDITTQGGQRLTITRNPNGQLALGDLRVVPLTDDEAMALADALIILCARNPHAR